MADGPGGVAALLLPGRPGLAPALAAFAGALVWLPIMHGLRLGFGYARPPLIALPLALTALWLRPRLWAGSAAGKPGSLERTPARRVGIALAAALLAGTALALARPRDERNPAWVSLTYEAGDSPRAGSYRAVLHQAHLPEFLAAGAEFRNDSGTWVAPAPGWDAPRPAARLLAGADGSLRDRRGHVVHLTSPRGASELFLTLPPGGRLLGVRCPQPEGLDAGERWIDTSGSEDTHWWFSGLGPEGVTVELVSDHAADLLGGEPGPARFALGDRSSQLPAFMETLLGTRPPHMAPRSTGDTSVLRTDVRL